MILSESNWGVGGLNAPVQRPGESAAAAHRITLKFIRRTRSEVGTGQERGEGRARFPSGRAAVGDARLASGVCLGSGKCAGFP
ncbi:hypothetical protein NDU88_007286 [Pleurodeles waltl]|uniref:Uncharacterized protein n=1 Tax=Pleurodeles waltl TaxID=8319 RepID=A0AAV7VT54_PLEWA|nr:hypothetical protein NDU88_007286 [Pleurodeles waltl]